VELTPLVIDIETTGLDPMVDEIVAIGIKHPEDEFVYMRDDEIGEESLVAFAISMVDDLNPDVIVGYNIKRFDRPFIYSKLAKYRIHGNTIYKAIYVDLMEIVCRYISRERRYVKLSEICEYLGIEKTDEVTGKDVPSLWKLGKYDEIEKHCYDDIRVTYELLKRLKPIVERYLSIILREEVSLDV